MIKSSKLYIFLGCLIVLSILNPYLQQKENLLLSSGYRGKEGMTQTTLLLRSFGMKKVGTAFIWIDQVLGVGEGGNPEVTINLIKENSDKMAYLDPYFLTNYNFSGTILGLIKIYKRYDLASDIFEKGIVYNPKDQVLKNYYAGVIASSKNDIGGLLINFERVVEKTKDDLLTSVIAYLYEKKYIEGGRVEDLNKALKHWVILLESKDESYREMAKRKIKTYRNNFIIAFG